MKYFKPTSTAWWGGVALLAYGAFKSITEKTFAPELAEGLAAIGIRAKMG